jgi:hypothetical protein
MVIMLRGREAARLPVRMAFSVFDSEHLGFASYFTEGKAGIKSCSTSPASERFYHPEHGTQHPDHGIWNTARHNNLVPWHARTNEMSAVIIAQTTKIRNVLVT